MSPRTATIALLAAMVGAGCSSSKTDSDYRAEVVSGMRSGLIADLADLVTSSQAMQSAAPTPADRGWDATADAAALGAMRAAWVSCRAAYEHVEGATAPIFPDIDAAIDARYDAALAALPTGDADLFDDQGFTGMHAAERILYADLIPARVVQYESMLQGYAPAAFPATAQQAADFKTRLAARQIADAQLLHDQWQAAKNYDLDAAFNGLIALMDEQREKVDKASTNQEESRYSQMTMADIRNNLVGTRKVYALFQPWIRSKPAPAGGGLDGAAIDASITQGFADLQALYDSISGDAIPQPPDSWSSVNPTAGDLQTPFGRLYAGVVAAVDPERQGSPETPASIVAQMNAAAALLGFDAGNP